MIGGFCKKLAWVYGVLGFIASIALAYKYGVTSKLLNEDYDYKRLYDDIKNNTVYERDWGSTIVIFFVVMISVLVVSVGLYTIGEIYDWLMALIKGYNERNEAQEKNMNTLMASMASGKKIEENVNTSEEVIPFGGWKCPKCGKAHQGYEDDCSCGYFKLNN